MLVLALIALLLAGWAVGEVIWPFVHALDLDVVRGIADERTTLLTGIAVGLSLAGSVLVILPLAAACCMLLYRSGHRASATVLALSVGGAGLIFNVEKLIVGRPRPPVAHLVVATHSSFPSGHATLSAAFYLALAIVFLAATRRRAVAVASVIATGLLVAGIALSRVYLGVHYPSDVVCGAMLGAAWTLLIARLLVGHRRQARTGATVLLAVDRPR